MSSKVILCLFDFLGYKGWFENDGRKLMSIVEMLKKVNDSCLALLKSLKVPHKIKFHNYADNLLFWTTDISERAADHFFLINSFVFNLLMEADIPLRGAITVGDVYFSSEDNIFTGGPLVEAHECERSQKWLGVTLCGSMESVYSPAFLQGSEMITKYMVPGIARDRWTLDWPNLSPHVPKAYGDHICDLDDIDRLESKTSLVGAKEKYHSTRIFYQSRVQIER